MQAACPHLGKFTLQSIISLGFRDAEHISARLPTQLRHFRIFKQPRQLLSGSSLFVESEMKSFLLPPQKLVVGLGTNPAMKHASAA